MTTSRTYFGCLRILTQSYVCNVLLMNGMEYLSLIHLFLPFNELCELGSRAAFMLFLINLICLQFQPHCSIIYCPPYFLFFSNFLFGGLHVDNVSSRVQRLLPTSISDSSIEVFEWQIFVGGGFYRLIC